MKVKAQDYDRMRAWFARLATEAFPAELMLSDADPIAALDRLATRSPAKAREGLTIAINELVEMTDGWPNERVAATDAVLLRDDLPSLTGMRGQFSKAVQRAVRRGYNKDDVEYYAVRNAVELAEDQREALWTLLAAYEENAAG